MQALKHLAVAFVFAVVLHAAVGADDKPVKHPMPPDVRASFDKAMKDLWHEDCQCWRFIYEGKIRRMKPPINDDLAWAILDVIERGETILVWSEKSGL